MSDGGQSGPSNKWVKLPLAETSDEVLALLNRDPHNPATAAFTADLNDGRFLFLGYYANRQGD